MTTPQALIFSDFCFLTKKCCSRATGSASFSKHLLVCVTLNKIFRRDSLFSRVQVYCAVSWVNLESSEEINIQDISCP